MEGPNTKIDCHFIKEKVFAGEITTGFFNSTDQLADTFPLEGPGLTLFVTSLMHGNDGIYTLA